MVNSARKLLGNLVIKLGEHSVGKCTIPGMYDPKIPQVLKDEVHFTKSETKK